MKKILTLTRVLPLVLFTLLISCSDDDKDTNNNGNNDKIIGSWVYNGYTDKEGNYHPDNTDPCYSFIVTFNSNKTGKDEDKDCKNGDETENFKWNAIGNNAYTIIYDNEEMNEGDDNTITVNFVSDQKIIVSYDGGEPETFTKK